MSQSKALFLKEEEQEEKKEEKEREEEKKKGKIGRRERNCFRRYEIISVHNYYL